YVAIPSTQLDFEPGQTTKTITVTINPAAQYDDPLTFTINLTAAAGGVILGGQGTGTIANPFPEPTVAIGAGTASPGEGEGNVFPPYDESFVINLSAASALATTVTYATADGTARAGTDYVGVAPTTVTLKPGQTQLTVLVAVYFEGGAAPAP